MKIYVKYEQPRYETSINGGCLGCSRNYKCLRCRSTFGYIGTYEMLHCLNWRLK